MSAPADPLKRHRELLARQPDNLLARFSLGKALYDVGQFAEAQTHLRAALAGKPDWMVVQILLGRCALGMNDPAAAREAFLGARELAIAQHHEGPLAELDDLLEQISG